VVLRRRVTRGREIEIEAKRRLLSATLLESHSPFRGMREICKEK